MPDEPVQPKPLLTGVMGAVVGLVIGVALAWFLAARQRVRPGEETAEARVDDDRTEPVTFIRDLVARTRTKVRPPRAALDAEATESEIGQLAGRRQSGNGDQSARRSTRWTMILICCTAWPSGWNLSTGISRRLQRNG